MGKHSVRRIGSRFRCALGVQALRFDPLTLKNLQTFQNKGKSLVRIGFSVVE